MMFNLLCSFLILATTMYLATQGMLSSLLALVTAIFSSILAMALMEPLQGIVGGFRPEFARGVTFLLIFFLTFAATRILADMMVPKDIKIPYLANRIAGAFVGFFAAMVVIGTCILGIQMMPLGTSLLGYDQFPRDSRMQASAGNTGQVEGQASTWFGSERFVQSIWNGASGRGLGGNRGFADVHPDLSAESYGYRNSVFYASKKTLLPESFEVKSGWTATEAKDLEPLKITPTEPGKRIVMVRTVVKKGSKPELDSADSDGSYFRITPTQVRLITDKGHQYYPIGSMEKGRTFVPLSLVDGQLIEDFVGGQVVEDWVFQIDQDEKPQMIEMKQLARADLGDKISEKIGQPLAAKEYPPRGYRASASSMTVTMTAKGQPLTEGKVYILRNNATVKDARSELRAAYDHVKDIANADQSLYPDQGKPGVPQRGLLRSMANDTFTNNLIVDAGGGANTSLQWERSLRLLIMTPIGPDGPTNIQAVPQFIKDTLEPMFNHVATGSSVVTSGTPDANGKVELKDIPTGDCCVFAWGKSATGFYFWTKPQDFKPKSELSLSLDSENAESPKLELQQ